MKPNNLEDYYWAERIAVTAFELGTDLPIDALKPEHAEIAKEKLLELYTTPGSWSKLLVEQLWADDKE
jgi:hypothetical protein